MFDINYSDKAAEWSKHSLWQGMVKDIVQTYIGFDGHVLDVGGNTGTVGLVMKRLFKTEGSYTVLEVNEDAQAGFVKNVAAGMLPPDSQWRHIQPMHYLKRAVERYDVVTCIHVLPHIPDQESAVRWMLESTKSWLIITYPNVWHDRFMVVNNLFNGYKPDPTHLKFSDPKKIKKLAEEYGGYEYANFTVGRRVYGLPGTRQWRVQVIAVD